MQVRKSIIALGAAALLSIPFAFAVGEPQNVSGLTANAVDEQSIGLSWNSARSANGGLVNHYRIYYGTTSVQQAGQGDYDEEVNTTNNNTSYVARGLQTGTKYYFSITAIDGAGLESEAYSLEASATTLGAAASGSPAATADTTPPTVVRVTAPYKTQVVVEFSEAVVLSAQNPQAAFSINEQIVTVNVLNVVNAALDAAGNKVILTTADQKPSMSYIVTAGATIEDAAGNPIVSGNTDSGLFVGSALAAPAEAPETMEEEGAVQETPADDMPAEAEAPAAEAAGTPAPVNCGNDEACFYNNLKDCTGATKVEVQNQVQTKQEVSGAEEEDCVLKYEVAGILELDNPKTLECRIPMAGLEARVTRVVDAQGKLFENQAEVETLCIGSYRNDFIRALFAATPGVDTTPPENITSLALSFREEMEKFIVMLRWIASINSAGDLMDQILYMSMNRGQSYDAGKSLGASATSNEVPDLEGGKEYTFKITTKDTAGNESTGMVKSIRLPQTGAAAGLLILFSALGARRLLKRRQK